MSALRKGGGDRIPSTRTIRTCQPYESEQSDSHGALALWIVRVGLLRLIWRAAASGANTPPLAAHPVAGFSPQESHELQSSLAENDLER